MKKLTITKEILRQLQDAQTSEIQGGVVITPSLACPSMWPTCSGFRCGSRPTSSPQI